MLNRSPDEALTEINARGRRPLTISEASLGCCNGRDGSANRGAPKVGWCWARNRHTWLGFASALDEK